MATYGLVGDLHQIVPTTHRLEFAAPGAQDTMTDDLNNATREVFGNIAPWMHVVFFVMIAASIGVLGWQIMAHVRLWRKGQPGGFERDWRVWIRRLMSMRWRRNVFIRSRSALFFTSFCSVALSC